ncbi:Dockerin type I repeat protein [Rubripirellula lacrimiformis]|uniref:Dockerin type I repeat protein n=1 Tax=Rubripirellula lacrimiformis TaxID=1930273 RepID=A0A517NEI5_9BACT|nr:dockerin type I domain-containing protein [Rubripirellula lacrimiformis]QDT05468.1 Dockerin type I repeat protein [Rubripirellula lacrimiformis]
MVAEGAIFDLTTPVDTAGLVGNASALIDWGDGTSSNGTVAGGNSTGNIKIVLDYSLDTNKFFGTSASDPFRIRLQQAADALASRFNDTLAAVAPKPYVTVRPKIFHPSQGPANSTAGTLHSLPENPTIAANTIIIYAGARDLPGASRGVGGGASISFTRTCIPGPQCTTAQANQDAIESRGEAGVLAANPTDIAPLYGSISFDTPTKPMFYLGQDGDAIAPDQLDFLSVATHELAHALGLGTSESWTTNVSGSVFTGPNARAAYEGSGNVPLSGGHWNPSVVALQPTLMGPSISFGQRVPFSPLDFAAMKDIGWEVANTSATVTASHRYGDDGSYPVSVTLSGSTIGKVEKDLSPVSVTNVAPTLQVPANRTGTVGQPISITDIGIFTDPGYAQPNGTPATNETFDFTVDWGDGTIDNGVATIDIAGNSTGRLTTGSFNASHTYAVPGTRTVKVVVTDDDGGTTQNTFQIAVNATPEITLQLSQPTVREDDGSSAATLTVSRSGPVLAIDQTVTLSSNDPSEATVPTSVVIRAGQSSVTTVVSAVDDALLDGAQSVTLTAVAAGATTGSIGLQVADYETLTARFTNASVVEGTTDANVLVISRSNTDVSSAITVGIAGAGVSQTSLGTSISLRAGEMNRSISFDTIDNDQPELPRTLQFTFTASGYDSAAASFEILDDESPEFQNPVNQFDVNNDSEVTASDALRVINQMARQSTPLLDPATEDPNGVFYDVNGDYAVTAVDALQVINELARRRSAATAQGSQAQTPQFGIPASEAVDDSARFDAALAASSIGWLTSPGLDGDDEDAIGFGLDSSGQMF